MMRKIKNASLFSILIVLLISGTTWSEPKLSPPLTTPGMFDIRAYGAVCDGVTDDTASIQATIDAAEKMALVSTDPDVWEISGNGTLGTILFPSGSCNVTTITVRAFGMKFLGVSPLISKIIGTSLTGSVIVWGHNQGQIENLNIGAETGANERGDHSVITPTAYSAGDPSAGKHGILFTPDSTQLGSDGSTPLDEFTQTRTYLRHVIVQDQPDDGIFLEQPELATLDMVISKENGRFGVHLNSETLGLGLNNTLRNVRTGPNNVNTGFRFDTVSFTECANCQVLVSTAAPQILARDGFNNRFVNPTISPTSYLAAAGIELRTEGKSSVIGGLFNKLAIAVQLTQSSHSIYVAFPRVVGDGGTPTSSVVNVAANSHDNFLVLGGIARYTNLTALTVITGGSTGNYIFKGDD